MSTSALVVIYREANAWPDTGQDNPVIRQYLCRSSTGLWLSDYPAAQWLDGPLYRLKPHALLVVPRDERLTACFLKHEDRLMDQGWELGTEPAPPGSIAFTG